MTKKEETIPKRCHDHEVVMTKLEAMQVSILRWCKTNTVLYLATIGIIAWGGCSALKDIDFPAPVEPPPQEEPQPPVVVDPVPVAVETPIWVEDDKIMVETEQ